MRTNLWEAHTGREANPPLYSRPCRDQRQWPRAQSQILLPVWLSWVSRYQPKRCFGPANARIYTPSRLLVARPEQAQRRFAHHARAIFGCGFEEKPCGIAALLSHGLHSIQTNVDARITE